MSERIPRPTSRTAARGVGRAWILSATLLAGATWVHAQAPKIGVFDPQRVSEETEEGKKVQTELTAFRDKKQGELQTKEKDLTELQNQLNAQALSLSSDRRASLEKELQRKALELSQARDNAQREMQLELATAQARFNDQLIAVVEGFGRDEGFTVILDSTVGAYAASAVDVTTAIVDRFNRAFRSEAGSQQTPEKAPVPGQGGD